jgi:UDP-2,4-diacetamido-2,4,6-trideoxy-beta-L-altropyranose hydrolase
LSFGQAIYTLPAVPARDLRSTEVRHRCSQLTSELTVLFRSDGTSDIGLGHTSRSVALAEAFADLGYRCLFFGHFDPTVQERLRGAGMLWETLDATSWGDGDASALSELAARTDAIGVVVDTYLADSGYVASVESERAPVLLIDDFATLSHYACSAVLNFTSRAPEFSYPCGSVRCYLGPKWFLGRRALRVLRARGPRPPELVRRVLVTSGGNDPYDVVLPFVQALLECDASLAVHVVVQAGYRARSTLECLLAQFRGETEILTQLPDLSRELAWADMCLANAGLTKYEAAYVGMPAGVLSQNEGQAKDAVKFAELGMTVDLGLAAEIDRSLLTTQIERMVADRKLREQLQQHSLAVFPTDPTRDLANSLLAEVFRGA